MICSDTLETRIFESLPHQEQFPYILLHIQLNPDPRHLGFREYRDFWGTHDHSNVEIICLNWAKNTMVFGNPIPFGASAWYFKSSDVVASDDEINNAHKLGAYYAESLERHFHCQFLNYAELVFQLRSSKISQVRSLPPTHRKRMGPRAIATLIWDSDLSDWQPAQPDDGFNNFCDTIDADLAPLTDQDMMPTNKERLICLANFAIHAKSKVSWPHIRSLASFELKQNEVCQRVTFCHDPDENSCQQRRRWLHQFATLKNEILAGAVRFPPHLQPLQAGGVIRYPALPGKFSFNVVNTDGTFPSAFVFIGDDSEQHAREVLDLISDILRDAKRSLVVWFRQNGQLTYLCPDGLNAIDADLSESSRSILIGVL